MFIRSFLLKIGMTYAILAQSEKSLSDLSRLKI